MPTPGDTDPDQTKTLVEVITAIAGDIEKLQDSYPQLVDFSSEEHLSTEHLKIDYGHKTHRSTRRGGWTAGVPNPDADGIWFYIDIHDPSSTAQIHTQPAVERLYLRDKLVMLLILEGDKTEKLVSALRDILTRHGVTTKAGS